MPRRMEYRIVSDIGSVRTRENDMARVCVSLFQYQVSWYGTFIAGYSPWQHAQHPLFYLPPYLAIWLVHANFLDDISQTLTGQAEKKIKLKIVLKGGKKEMKKKWSAGIEAYGRCIRCTSLTAGTHSQCTNRGLGTHLLVCCDSTVTRIYCTRERWVQFCPRTGAREWVLRITMHGLCTYIVLYMPPLKGPRPQVGPRVFLFL